MGAQKKQRGARERSDLAEKMARKGLRVFFSFSPSSFPFVPFLIFFGKGSKLFEKGRKKLEIELWYDLIFYLLASIIIL